MIIKAKSLHNCHQQLPTKFESRVQHILMEKTEAYAEIHVFQLHQLNIYIKLCKSTKISNMIFTSYNIHIESRHNI